jgi:hypothetical protein
VFQGLKIKFFGSKMVVFSYLKLRVLIHNHIICQAGKTAASDSACQWICKSNAKLKNASPPRA